MTKKFDKSLDLDKYGNQRRRRGKGAHTAAMKDCIIKAFHELGGKDYLVSVGAADPRTFLGLVRAILPAELNITGSLVIDVGQAMLDAENRSKCLENERHNVIDVTPEPEVIETKGKDESS